MLKCISWLYEVIEHLDYLHRYNKLLYAYIQFFEARKFQGFHKFRFYFWWSPGLWKFADFMSIPYQGCCTHDIITHGYRCLLLSLYLVWCIKISQEIPQSTKGAMQNGLKSVLLKLALSLHNLLAYHLTYSMYTYMSIYHICTKFWGMWFSRLSWTIGHLWHFHSWNFISILWLTLIGKQDESCERLHFNTCKGWR